MRRCRHHPDARPRPGAVADPRRLPLRAPPAARRPVRRPPLYHDVHDQGPPPPLLLAGLPLPRPPRPSGGDAVTRLARALLLAAIPFVAGVAVCRAQEAPDARYSPATRSPRQAVLARAEVADLAALVWGPDLAPRVAAVVQCESGGRPGARNAGYDPYWGAYSYEGLMQVERTLWSGLALELTGSDDLTAPLVNLTVGYAIYRRSGWSAWPSCGRTW